MSTLNISLSRYLLEKPKERERNKIKDRETVENK